MALNSNRLLKPVKKLRKVIRKIDRQPAPELVHDLRTNTRRLEAMFEALSLDRQAADKSLLKALGRLRKRAGKVRDMDVLTGQVSCVQPEGDAECRIQLLEHLGAQREKHARRLFAEVRRVRTESRSGLKRASSALTDLLENTDAPASEKAVANATAVAVRLVARLARPPHLTRENLHRYRLRVKDLQNVLRMAESDTSAEFVDDLGKVKDAIGEWHDWQELVGLAGKVVSHRKRCGLQSELKRITRQKYDHALSLAEKLRTTYLQSPTAENDGVPSPGLRRIPRQPVWEATAMLAV